jgi:hypothetical protein
VPIATSVSPDGRELLGTIANGRPTVWARSLPEAASQFRWFLDRRMVETDPQVSADGRWVAYASNRSGRQEIYVVPYPRPGGTWQVSTDGGTMPRWADNGRELFYRNGDRMMAVDVDTASTTFRSGMPRLLFEKAYEADYDVTRDGARFLMVKPGGDRVSVRGRADAPLELHLVVNWTEELRQRLPLK